ncbi:hypothetical protein L2E82_01284 [Cichorium intybus]|uniref:Uncharacterized protein n=1 Tax=Cichorium intybus TaxID=13427 RepID=A0ACB9GZQ4_CICIN|nr:hypothetical protein L2E82_01284 [Cichorium intybus]
MKEGRGLLLDGPKTSRKPNILSDVDLVSEFGLDMGKVGPSLACGYAVVVGYVVSFIEFFAEEGHRIYLGIVPSTLFDRLFFVLKQGCNIGIGRLSFLLKIEIKQSTWCISQRGIDRSKWEAVFEQTDLSTTRLSIQFGSIAGKFSSLPWYNPPVHKLEPGCKQLSALMRRRRSSDSVPS